MPRLILIRHCQSTAQHPPAPLTQAGARAAEALAERLAELAPDAVYSSPYERAHATVRPFARRAGLPVTLDERLRERLLSDQDRDDWLDHIQRSFDDFDHRAPGGETMRETQTRALAALAEIAGAGHRLPAVASHGGLISSVLRAMDPAFGFEGWRGLRNPDLFDVELSAAGRPVGYVRLEG
jgi:2,3-bisphosphoglycerate-dependent phosphoglycerate mutase